jgi:hypothetical protein
MSLLSLIKVITQKMIKYILIFLSLIVTEILIAIFYIHPIIRHFVGDILVIPLIYYFMRIFFNDISSERLVLYVLLFAFGIETLQYFLFADILKIESTLFRTIMGTVFAVSDLVAYVLGGLMVLTADKLLKI